MAGKRPPAYGVDGGPATRASHSRRLDSEMGPAVMPSGGEEVRVLYSWKSLLEAIELAMMLINSWVIRASVRNNNACK